MSLINQRKHGLTFEEAVEAGEERWQTFGIVKRVHLLMVATPSRNSRKMERWLM